MPAGIGERLGLGGERLLGEAAVGEDGHHAIARLESRHAVAARGHDPGRLEARAEGQRGLVW